MFAVNGTTWLRMYSSYRRHSTGERAVTPRTRSASPRVASATDTFLFAVLVLGCLRLTLPQEHFGFLHTTVSVPRYGWLLFVAAFFFLAERSSTVANFRELAPFTATVASSAAPATAKRKSRSQSPGKKARSRSPRKPAKERMKDA